LGGEGEGVPNVFTVDDHGATGGDDAEEAEDKLDEWEEENLPVDALFFLQVASEIRDVGCHCCPASCDGGEGGEDEPGTFGAVDTIVLFPDVT